MNQIPRIKAVVAAGDLKLAVLFENEVEKEYDCTPLLVRDYFQPLRNPAFFRAVKVDAGGYGISWNDDLDLGEYELWMNGISKSTR